MITIITGTPGAGKTLYSIAKLLLPLVGTTVDVPQEDGTVKTVPRTIYTNINGLQIDHELIEAGPVWDCSSKGATQAEGNKKGLHNWHEWATPGAVIVYDEFQRAWPPRANGAAVPPDLQALDTHRHKGVDFILITQGVMNTDRHVHALCGRHLHVRRVGNTKVAIVYEWDHCSRTLQFGKSIVKHFWRLPPAVFKLYKSAEVHTKQPRKMPGLVWFLAIAAIGMAYLGPTVYARITERAQGPQAKNDMHVAQAPSKPASAPARPAPTPALPASSPKSPATQETPVVGCAAARGVCRCYDVSGKRIDKPVGYCEAETEPGPVSLSVVQVGDEYSRRVDHNAAADVDVIEWMAARGKRAIR